MKPVVSLLLACICVGSGSSAFAAGPVVAKPASARFYCCIDATGKQICGDIVPRECYGRAYKEMGANGQVIREVDAPLTAEQKAQRAAEEARRKEDDARLKEQQRKDQALLNTYGTVDDIESMRQRSLDDVNKSIKSAEARIEQIRVLRKKFEEEAEFYKKKTLPPDVKKGLRDSDFEIKAQESIIEAKRKEVAIIQSKYDEDRQRFLDLQSRPKQKTVR